MNIRAIGFYIGHILRIEGVLLVPALLIALFCHERESLHAFGITILILAVLSMALLSLGFIPHAVGENPDIYFCRRNCMDNGFKTKRLLGRIM